MCSTDQKWVSGRALSVFKIYVRIHKLTPCCRPEWQLGSFSLFLRQPPWLSRHKASSLRVGIDVECRGSRQSWMLDECITKGILKSGSVVRRVHRPVTFGTEERVGIGPLFYLVREEWADLASPLPFLLLLLSVPSAPLICVNVFIWSQEVHRYHPWTFFGSQMEFWGCTHVQF